MDLQKIQEHWEQAGEKLSMTDLATPTSRDPFLAKLESANIAAWLQPHFSVLEVGCGDAQHTLEYARQCTSVLGVDVASSLVERARERASGKKAGNVEFRCHSVLDLGDITPPASFDCIISQRCLINLPTWENQRDAITQLHRLLKPGGLLLLTEGFDDELDALNDIRRKVGLEEIRVVSYNRNFRHAEFDGFISTLFEVEAVRDYGFYLFCSRVYHPLAVFPEPPRHDARLNEVAALLVNEGVAAPMKQYSYNLFYALRKPRS